MSSFTEAVRVPVPGLKWDWRQVYVVEGLVYYLGWVGDDATRIIVPDGTLTDGPSVPYWVYLILWVFGRRRWLEKMIKSSAVHDYARQDARFTLRESDCVFYMALQAEGCPRVVAFLAFLAVRLNKSRRRPEPTEPPL